MFQFFKNLFRRNHLKQVEQHLASASAFKAAHVDALTDAQDSAVNHILSKQDEIAGLSQAIGQAQSSINTANDHLDTINAALKSA